MQLDNSITAAMISGGLAIAAPLVTLFVTRRYDQRELKKITYTRRDACEGVWKGAIHQMLREKPIVLDVLMTLSVGRKLIHGDIRVQNPDEDIDATLLFTGGFHLEQFLKLDYSNSDKHVRQFGSMVLELSDEGMLLTGKFAGYGAKSKRIIGGDIELKKVKTKNT